MAAHDGIGLLWKPVSCNLKWAPDSHGRRNTLIEEVLG
jgi:hypothetical protein